MAGTCFLHLCQSVHLITGDYAGNWKKILIGGALGEDFLRVRTPPDAL